MTEQISALADDEIALEDAEYLMTAMQPNSHSAEIWSQYHLIGDVMRGANALSPNFKQNLMSKIELEPTVLSPNVALMNTEGISQQTRQTNFKMPATWSIAASFVAVMMVGWMVLETQVTNDFAPVEIAQVDTTPVASALVTSNKQAVEQIIPTEYLTAHQAYAPSASSYYIQSANYSE
jgi:sigma-E factor negative regulatory protein RseA